MLLDIFFRVQGKGAHADPGPKALRLVGSLVGKRTTLSDEELATQTRF
jgi:hypothetical protein